MLCGLEVLRYNKKKNTTRRCVVRIRLLDGTYIETQGAPSKRSNKNTSGRQGRKTWNARRTETAVGGYNNDAKAIYASPNKELCVVVTDKRTYTDSPGMNVRSAGGKATS